MSKKNQKEEEETLGFELKDVEEAIQKGEHFRKEAPLIWDSKQFSVKIPKKISEALKMQKDDKLIFHLIPIKTGSKGNFELRIDYYGSKND